MSVGGRVVVTCLSSSEETHSRLPPRNDFDHKILDFKDRIIWDIMDPWNKGEHIFYVIEMEINCSQGMLD